MQKEELFEGIEEHQDVTQKYLGLSLAKFFLLFALVIALGIYIGNLLYGNSSLEVLLGLEEYENYLKSQIKELKSENAELQREYFELKEISAD